MRQFTLQEVIDMGADLYDNKGFDRATMWKWLKAINDHDMITEKLDSERFDRVYDLIIG